MFLPWNRLHVFANHFVVSGFPIAQVRAYDGDIARKTEREQSLVVETDVDAERPVVDGMADVIHNLALKTRIPPSRRTQTHRLRRECFTIRHWSRLFPA